MKSIIELKNISKEFKVLNRREGLGGSIKDLFSRNYNIIKAVDDVSLSINQGEMVGYLGPNGAGKSTTIKMMSGVLEPTSGTILVNGKIPYKNRTQNAQNIGVVFGQRTQLWWSLPVIESFKILKDIYQIPDKDYQDQLALYESLIDLKPLYSKPVRQMSLGQRTLCDILAAFLHNPSVIFLDEPTIGLDVSMKAKIRVLIHELNTRRNTTVILTTHDIGDVDALCKRIIIIDKGTMLYDNSAQKLKGFFGAYRTLKIRIKEGLSREDNIFGYVNISSNVDLNENVSNSSNENPSVDFISNKIREKFPDATTITVTKSDDWFSIMSNEDETPIMLILQYLQEIIEICDIKIEEIVTEEIIKKIYEGNVV